MAKTRYVGRANIAKRLQTLTGSPGRIRYHAGCAILELEDRTLIVTPPFGLEHEGDYEQLEIAPLLAALEADRVVATVLVRLGGYAVGVFDGERLVVELVQSLPDSITVVLADKLFDLYAQS